MCELIEVIGQKENANFDGVITDRPTGIDAAELEPPLEELIAAHEEWIESDGASGTPVNFSGFDLRKVRSLAGAKLTALPAPRANMIGLDLSKKISLSICR